MGNTFGKLFRVTTFGESHGAALGCVIDGCPPNISVQEADIQKELDRRLPGQSPVTTQRKEADRVRILSGTFEGKTLGTPIALIIENIDQKSQDYDKLKEVFRPGHADFTWQTKFGIRDHRGGGRSSGRETAARVMAGAVAKQILVQEKINIIGHAVQTGPVQARTFDPDCIEKNSVRSADPNAAVEMETYIKQAQGEGDSVGGIVELRIRNVPIGLGEPVFDKLNADLAKAIISIPAVKGVEFGAGFTVATKRGSEQNDPFVIKAGTVHTEKNDAGGILGGISSGEEIVMRIAVKPPSSISKAQQTVTTQGTPTEIQVTGRHDPCIIPRLIPVAESMAALVIVDHILRYRGQCGNRNKTTYL